MINAVRREVDKWRRIPSPNDWQVTPEAARLWISGRLALFRNFDADHRPLARPNTLLIDSEQLESGDALDRNFRTLAADEIDRFKREALERGGDLAARLMAGKEIEDATLLREERLTAAFNDDSVFELTPTIVGPSKVENSGIIGETVELKLAHLK